MGAYFSQITEKDEAQHLQNIRSWSALEKLGYRYVRIEKGNVAGYPVKWKVYTLAKADWERLDWPTK